MAPYALEIILKVVKHLPFSIATDASNKGNKKLFPIVIRYFNVNDYEQPIVHALIEFKQIWGETAEDIFNIIQSTINHAELDIKNITSFGADNAPVNFECSSSVFTKLQANNKNLIKANCDYHIFHNTAKYALKTMKYDVETLVLKIYSEFLSGTCCTKELKDCFDFLDQSYFQVLKHVSTSWLSLYKVTDRLLKNWSAITFYFLNQGEDECNPTIWKFICKHENGITDTKSLPELN